METLEITTNYRNRPFLYGYEVPEKVLSEDYSHLSEGEKVDGFIKYRGCYYHISDFLLTDEFSFPEYWHGYSSGSYFSGTLIRVSDDSESYQIATFLVKG